MKVKYKSFSIPKYSFEEIPVGSYFAPESYFGPGYENYTPYYTPYLKISPYQAYSFMLKKIFETETFPASQRYCILNTDTVVEFTPSFEKV